ncbi:MAG: RluA family pseudouridine synthase [Vicingaceae bacterium]|nr:RluA family pseudouridine synthase [Vicingaceae bacterium]
MPVINTHIVPRAIAETRLSDYLLEIFPNLPSRKGIKKAIKRGEVLVNGEASSTGYWVKANDKIELLESSANPPKSYDLKLEIVFEDDYMAVINKPAGISVSGNQYRTIQNALMDNVKLSTQEDALRWVKPVHRLDSPTSGLLIVAKTAKALVRLGQQFENMEIQKTYVAIVNGKPPEGGTIDFDIDGLASQTDYELVKTVPSLKNEFVSLVKLFPKTGRTHQIRKHLSQLGFPIVGDKMYGEESELLNGKGLFLCSLELLLKHPIEYCDIKIETTIPYKFTSLLERENRRWEKFNQ